MNLKAMNASKTSKSILYQSSWKIGTWLFPTTTLGGKNEFMVAKILNQASTTLTSGFVFKHDVTFCFHSLTCFSSTSSYTE